MSAASLVERLLPPVDPLGEDGQPKPSRMQAREQLVAAGLGFTNVAIAAGSAAVMGEQKALVLLSGLLAAAVTIAGARMGNRIIAIVGLFASTLLRPSSATIFLIVVMPYYAAAMWMFLRYNRLVKAQAVQRRQQRADGTGRTAASTRTSAKDRPGKAGRSKATPTASKRYTPPKPAKKRPPPPPKPPRDRSIVD